MTYSEAFHLDGLYTPQLVVDGSRQLVGGSTTAGKEIASAARRAKAKVDLAALPAGDGSTEIQVAASHLPPIAPGDEAELWLAIAEDNLRSEVLRGENAGRKLTHAAVVRRLELIARAGKGEQEISGRRREQLDPHWDRGHLKAVAFVQEKKSRRVLGAAEISLTAR